MKKLSLLLLCFSSFMLVNCTQTAPATKETKIEKCYETLPYKLFPTDNLWTFIKLDTRNGKMWQVQFSVKGDDYRFECPLNLTPLVSEDSTPGRFELYPTQNMYNFILLDGIEGKTWQVQWSTEPENQAVMPIQQVGNNF